jgi:hypothetical protein
MAGEMRLLVTPLASLRTLNLKSSQVFHLAWGVWKLIISGRMAISAGQGRIGMNTMGRIAERFQIYYYGQVFPGGKFYDARAIAMA